MITLEKAQLEKTVLGSLIAYKQVRDTAIEQRLNESDFDDPTNREIFQIFEKSIKEYKQFDLTILRKATKEQGALSKLTVKDLKDIVDSAGRSSNFESHVKALKDESIKVRLYKICGDTRYQIADQKGTGNEIIADHNNNVSDVIEGTTTVSHKTFSNYFMDAIAEMEVNAKRDDGLLGLPSGVQQFDHITGGFLKKQLTVLAASPGEGKTTFALNIAQYLAEREIPVLFFTLEMGGIEIVYKTMSTVSNNSVQNIRSGKEINYDKINKIANLPLHIIPKAGITIDEIVAISKNKIKKDKIQLIVVDYIQIVSSGLVKESKEERVGSIAKKLKILSMDLDIPVLALSQLNRDKKRMSYTLADLRGSGQLEQHPDNVVFIYRPIEHDLESYTVGKDTRQCTESDAVIKIAKCRLGQTGSFWIQFNGQCSMFYEDGYSPFPKKEDDPINSNENLPF